MNIICLILFFIIINTSNSFALSWLFNQKDKTHTVCESIDNGGNDLKSQLLRAAKNRDLSKAEQIIDQVKNDKSLWSSPDKFSTSGWIDSTCDSQNNTALSISLLKGYINIASYLAKNGAQKIYSVNDNSKDICAYARSIHRTFEIHSKFGRLKRNDIEFLKEEISLLDVDNYGSYGCPQEQKNTKYAKTIQKETEENLIINLKNANI